MLFLEFLEQKVEYIMFNNNKYYNFLSLSKLLSTYENKKLYIDDTIIVPYYISNGKIYEIYDYELFIVVNGIELNEYILKKTGRSSLNNINSDLLKKFDLCYMNLNLPYVDTLKMINYVTHILNGEDMRCRIYNIFNEYVIENLYFEVY